MGLLKKLGLKKKSKQKNGDDATDSRRSERLAGKAGADPQASEPEIVPDSPEPENDFAAALRQRSAGLRHVEAPKLPLALTPITPPQYLYKKQVGGDSDSEDEGDDEGEIEIEAEESDEEGENEFLSATRNQSLKKENSQGKDINDPQAEVAPSETKNLADERVARMFAKQKQDDMTRAKNRADERVAEMLTKQKQSQADERVAQMFNKQNDSSRIEKDFGYRPPPKKGTADERVAQMFGKQMSSNDIKPIRGLNRSSNHNTSAPEFNDSTKAISITEIHASGMIESSVLSFAERREMAEALSQRKISTNEQKHTVDMSHENFGNKSSFAQRRKMLEAKSQNQQAPSMSIPVKKESHSRRSNEYKDLIVNHQAQSNLQHGGLSETKTKE